MNILRPENAGPVKDSLVRWCVAQLGFDTVWPHYETLGVFDGPNLSAVMVYHNWYPKEGVIEISGAAVDRKWLTRRVLFEMFSYPFDRLGCQLVVMRVSPNNKMTNGRGVRRMLKAYGFNEYLIPRLRGRHEDEIIFTLADDHWRANGYHEVQNG